MRFGLKILENNNEITKAILSAMLPDVNAYLNRVINYIKKNLPNVITQIITDTPEYESLVGGQLKYELGLSDADSKVEGLLNIWMNNIEYIYEPPKIINNNIKSNFSANMIRIDFSDVLYSPYAEMEDTIRGYSLPWLQWLLLEGNKVIVPNHSVILGPNPRSRTGNAIMINSKSNWKIPAQFSGSASDNWITRAIDSAQNEIQSLIDRAGAS